MAQYCRYCAFCINGDVPYCTDHEMELSESAIKRVNRCPDFVLSELGDVDSGRRYTPRHHAPSRAKDRDAEQLDFSSILSESTVSHTFN